MAAELRDLPQIETLLRQPALRDLASTTSHDETVDALRGILDRLRHALRTGETDTLPDFTSVPFARQVAEAVEAGRAASLRPLINATGILIHTNLGRARLAPEAVAAMQTVAAQAVNLEYDIDTGKRGSRHSHTERLICQLTGAEAAVVVNNCAAAVLLGLMATAQGRKVIASRGELIEIGGAFRLPDVIAQSGAELREVGTTNKTRLSDYAQAVDEDTAVLLKSHASNFRIVGFTSAPDRAELAQLARAQDVILMEDLGSGVLIDLAPWGLADEPVVRDILRAGVDLVMFSGDKLLGGPQAGIIAGRADIVARLRTHPLMRAVRIDKLSLAALEATLRLYLPPNDPMARVPVLQMLAAPLAQLRARAEAIVEAVGGHWPGGIEVVETRARVGAGAMPEQDIPSFGVALTRDGQSAETLAGLLRAARTPVIGRIRKDRVLLDMRGMTEDEAPALIATLDQIARQ